MSKFLFNLEKEIIERIVDSSKMPFIIIENNTLKYDQHYNHICKVYPLNYDTQDILFTIKNSKKLYYKEMDGKFIVGLDDGSWIIYYQTHTDPSIQILEIDEYDRIDINYTSTLDELIEQIDNAKSKLGNLNEQINRVVNSKLQQLVDAGMICDEELLKDLGTKLCNDYFATKIMT